MNIKSINSVDNKQNINFGANRFVTQAEVNQFKSIIRRLNEMDPPLDIKFSSARDKIKFIQWASPEAMSRKQANELTSKIPENGDIFFNSDEETLIDDACKANSGVYETFNNLFETEDTSSQKIEELKGQINAIKENAKNQIVSLLQKF